MKSNMTWHFAAVMTAALVLPLVAQNDTITMKDGSTKNGKVLDWNFKSVEVAVGGAGSTRIKAEDVASIAFDAVPKAMKEADAAFSGGRDAEAIEKYRAIIEDKKTRKPLMQDAWWKCAEAQRRTGKLEEAAETLKTMLNAGGFGESRYLVEADDLIPQWLIWAGKADAAASFTSEEEARVGKLGVAGQGERLKLWRARALLAKGDTGKAGTEASALAGGSGTVAADAKVLLGTIALAGNKHEEAERLFREAMAVTQTPSVRASCFAGLGEVLLARALKSKKPDEFKEALLCYLRPVVQYSPDAGGDTDAYAIALFGAGVCFQSIGELEKDAEKQKVSLSRARENYRKLLDNFPNSPRAAEARERLSRVGG
jgi:tetratricopeptide (TPR) repeat protein